MLESGTGAPILEEAKEDDDEEFYSAVATPESPKKHWSHNLDYKPRNQRQHRSLSPGSDSGEYKLKKYIPTEEEESDKCGCGDVHHRFHSHSHGKVLTQVQRLKLLNSRSK